MEEQLARKLITETGRELLREELVARTWGNVSCRVDEMHYLITPSGLDYNSTTEEDLALMNLEDGSYTGPRKPSSEKLVHTAAYEVFPEAQFVIHTHQLYASALGVYGFDKITFTEEEIQALGGVAEAEYGLPGTETLQNNVRKAMETGAHTVIMKNHGVIAAGSSKEDAFAKLLLLEKICEKNWLGKALVNADSSRHLACPRFDELKDFYPHVSYINTEPVRVWSSFGEAIVAQLDDMAQMIGRKIPVVKREKAAIIRALKNHNVILIRNFGAIVNGDDEDDTEALKILTEKACVTALQTKASGVKVHLSELDCRTMRHTYVSKYSKLKNEKKDKE